MSESQNEQCGFIPPTPGYAPCTRKKGHDGPCAHYLLSRPLHEPIKLPPYDARRARVEASFDSPDGEIGVGGLMIHGETEDRRLAEALDMLRKLVRRQAIVPSQIQWVERWLVANDPDYIKPRQG